MPDTNQVGENRLKFVPESLVNAFGRTIVVKTSAAYSRTNTVSGIALPGGADSHHEKKYEIGEVVSAGKDARNDYHINDGDIVVYQCARAYRLPNGQSKTSVLWHLLGDSSTVVCILPNPDKPESWEKFNLSDRQKEVLELCRAEYMTSTDMLHPDASFEEIDALKAMEKSTAESE